jgi:hypothetical protein
MSENQNTTSAGLGFSTILALIFITLKLCNVIEWSWLWVLSPFWISVSFTFVVLFVFEYLKEKRKSEKIARSKALDQKLRDLNKN